MDNSEVVRCAGNFSPGANFFRNALRQAKGCHRLSIFSLRVKAVALIDQRARQLSRRKLFLFRQQRGAFLIALGRRQSGADFIIG